MTTFNIYHSIFAEPPADTEQPPKLLAVISWILFLVVSLYQGEVNSDLFFAALLLTIIHFASGLKKDVYPARKDLARLTILEFGEQHLLYKNKDRIIWSIPFERLDSVQRVVSGGRFSSKRSAYLVFTNDGDSYLLAQSMDASQLEEIQREIEKVKVQDRTLVCPLTQGK